MTRISKLALACLVPVLVVSCGAEAKSPSQATVQPAPRSVLAPAGILSTVADLQRDYLVGNWSGVRQVVVDHALAASIVQKMQQWKSERVRNLTISLVYSARLVSGDYEGTVQYAADPRAIPDYSTLVFRLRGRVAQITGTTTGIRLSAWEPPRWSVSQTAHFVVYHSSYQLVGSDRQYLRKLEHQRAAFERKFGVKLPPRAVYYLYPDRPTMATLTGNGCGARPGETGCAHPFAHPPTIQGVIRANYHEPIHIYELALVPPPPPKRNLVWVAPLFVGEGTAVALEDPEADPRLSDYCSDLAYAPLDECARIAAAHTQPLSILSDSGFTRADPGYAYSLGGSFAKYLMLKYGYRAFGRFYYTLAGRKTDHVSDYDAAGRAVYHTPIRSLIHAWMSALCSQGCQPSW